MRHGVVIEFSREEEVMLKKNLKKYGISMPTEEKILDNGKKQWFLFPQPDKTLEDSTRQFRNIAGDLFKATAYIQGPSRSGQFLMTQ